MIANLFNAPLGETETAVGVGTVGSSEAIMLAGLAFKRKWQNKRKAEGKPFNKPNIVTGANVHQVNNDCSRLIIVIKFVLLIIFLQQRIKMLGVLGEIRQVL